MTRRLPVFAALALAVLVGLTAWFAADRQPPSAQQRVTAVAETLACPACEGQSVAQSQSEMAVQMRTVVSRQVHQGRSDAEIRQWFADRYGDGVLLSPPARGVGLVLWVVPALVVIVGLRWVLRAHRAAARRADMPASHGAPPS
jgi:cytochrome c-type biogenesis protein CcmH/NrfF